VGRYVAFGDEGPDFCRCYRPFYQRGTPKYIKFRPPHVVCVYMGPFRGSILVGPGSVMAGPFKGCATVSKLP